MYYSQFFHVTPKAFLPPIPKCTASKNVPNLIEQRFPYQTTGYLDRIVIQFPTINSPKHLWIPRRIIFRRCTFCPRVVPMSLPFCWFGLVVVHPWVSLNFQDSCICHRRHFSISVDVRHLCFDVWVFAVIILFLFDVQNLRLECIVHISIF